LVLKGIALQLVFALLILRTSGGRAVFDGAARAVNFVLDASKEGTALVFGALAEREVFGKAMGNTDRWGFVFFVHVTGTIILVSALMSALYYLHIMQWVVWAMAKVMQVTMGTSGSESLAAAANVFVGQTEAPLVIKPYLERMTPSELMALMTGGMATIAGGVMAAYIGFLSPHFPNEAMGHVAGHLLAASVMSAPAALVMAKIIVPETQQSETRGQVRVAVECEGTNLLDAICTGASDGLKLSLNVMAMLIAFTALVFLVNAALRGLTGWLGTGEITLQDVLGWLFAPLALAMGVPSDDALAVGSLLGERTMLNEFVAYQRMSSELKDHVLHPRSAVIVTYALCGFANFASIAIQIGGIGSLVPSRRADLARFGLRAMIAGTLASFMTANIAGALMPESALKETGPATAACSAPNGPAHSRAAAIEVAFGSDAELREFGGTQATRGQAGSAIVDRAPIRASRRGRHAKPATRLRHPARTS
jgi:CNT family concentrative nucleoside transporter